MPNLFELAASIMNVESKLLSTFKINIKHSEQFFSLSLTGWFLFPGFLLVGIKFLLLNTDSIKYADISHYYPYHEGARRSLMRIHDVAGKFVINCPHHGGTEFIA
jgi:hypothetical protein